jgi:hypothetical protein
MSQTKRDDNIDARCRSDHRGGLIDDRWGRRDDNWRRCRLIDDRRRRRCLIDDRWRTLTLIGVILTPFAALMLVAPLTFALMTTPTVFIGPS